MLEIQGLSAWYGEARVLEDVSLSVREGEVVTLVGHADTELGTNADRSFVNFAEDDTSCESFYLQSYFFALTILRVHDGRADAAQLLTALQTLPPSPPEVKPRI